MRPRNAFIMAGLCVGAALTIISTLTILHQNARPAPSPSAQRSEEDGFSVVDWQYWKDVNPDVIGWVNIPGTNIDHPIVAADHSDPDFYLKHDVYRNYNPFGIPFLDADCERDLNAPNAIIYGHHVNDGSMFSDLANFIDPVYAADHNMICLQTPDKKVKLTVCYIDVIDGASTQKRTSFTSLGDFLAWHQNELANATLVLDEGSVVDRIVTFCTCSYTTYHNERTIVATFDESAVTETEKREAQ